MDEVGVVERGTGLELELGPWLPLTAVLAVLMFWVGVLILNRLLCICGPNEILVISGRRHVLGDGSRVGYKVLHGGRGIRIPILEEINRMDTRIIPVMVEVKNAYSKGGIPLIVHAIANVKISTHPDLVRNAIERLLNFASADIASVARQTLEGVLREVVAELTPEEVNEDRLKFAATLMRNAKDDFDKLGLELDVLKVQSVSDEQGYLKSLGRALIANMIRDAENAENRAQQVIAEAEAEARQRADTATKQAETTVLMQQNLLRAELARFEAEAKAVENEAAFAEQTARAEAEQELQLLRAELARKRLEVEVTIPAEAQRRATEAHARAEAAPALEAGKATARALRLLSEQWGHAGGLGRELYVLQHLDELVGHAAARVENSRLGELSVVDGGDGQSYARALAMYPAAVASVMQAVGLVLGTDMRRILVAEPEVEKSPRPVLAE
jgi:flotillin